MCSRRPARASLLFIAAVVRIMLMSRSPFHGHKADRPFLRPAGRIGLHPCHIVMWSRPLLYIKVPWKRRCNAWQTGNIWRKLALFCGSSSKSNSGFASFLPSFLPSSSFLASTRLASSLSLAQHFDPFYIICAMNPLSVYMVVAVGSY